LLFFAESAEVLLTETENAVDVKLQKRALFSTSVLLRTKEEEKYSVYNK
jgi:hypothetical protein